MSSISETSIVTNYFEWPNDLQQATQYTFSVRTVLNCTVSGAQTLTSDWVDVIAFTSPGTPELSQVDYGTDFIQLAITDSSVYDLIRSLTIFQPTQLTPFYLDLKGPRIRAPLKFSTES